MLRQPHSQVGTSNTNMQCVPDSWTGYASECSTLSPPPSSPAPAVPPAACTDKKSVKILLQGGLEGCVLPSHRCDFMHVIRQEEEEEEVQEVPEEVQGHLLALLIDSKT